MKKIILTLSIFLIVLFSFGQQKDTDTLYIQFKNLLTQNLKEGTTRYLTYIERPNNKLLQLSIWERKIKIDSLKQEISIEQFWKNVDTLGNRYIYSICKKSNFKPIYHYSKSGNDVIEAYDFEKELVHGSDSIPLNTKKDFTLKLPESCLNFELDMEVFQTLPLEMGKTYMINFYHPGGQTNPQYYAYKVVDEDTTLNCWLLQVVYDQYGKATFWINKDSHEVIKMKETYNTITRYKIKFSL